MEGNFQQQSTSSGAVLDDSLDGHPPAMHYFFHHDPRVRDLVRDRLHHFFPIGAGSTRENEQSRGESLSYRCISWSLLFNPLSSVICQSLLIFVLFNAAGSSARVWLLKMTGWLQIEGYQFQLMLAKEGCMPVELNLALAIGLLVITGRR